MMRNQIIKIFKQLGIWVLSIPEDLGLELHCDPVKAVNDIHALRYQIAREVLGEYLEWKWGEFKADEHGEEMMQWLNQKEEQCQS